MESLDRAVSVRIVGQDADSLPARSCFGSLADASAFFDAVRDKVRAGAPVAVALRDVRRQWLGDRRADWVRDVIVFE